MVEKIINNQTQWDTYIQTLNTDVEGFRIIPKTHAITIRSLDGGEIIVLNNIKIKNNGTIFIWKKWTIANNGTITNKGTINNILGIITNNKDAKLNNDGDINALFKTLEEFLIK